MKAFQDKEEMESKKSVRDILVEFMGYTTGHGFGRLIAATSFVWRLFWVLAVLASFGMFIFEVVDLFKMYFSRPVQTSVTVTFEKKLQFPAVTICNLNMIKKSRKSDLPEIIVESLTANDTKNQNENKLNTTRMPGSNFNATTDYPTSSPGKRRRKRDEDYLGDENDGKDDYSGDNYSGDDYSGDDYSEDDKWEDDYWEDDYEFVDEGLIDPQTKLRMKVEAFIGGEPPEYLYSVGHNEFDLIEHCTWKGVDCIEGNLSKHWRWSWNYRYGNCFTFNDGMDDSEEPIKVLTSSKPGPSQGLVLQLNIESEQYLGELSEEAGVRVALHEPGAMPFPPEEGFSVGPGMATSVGLTKTIIKRLDRFDDGSCSKEGVPLSEDNLYRKYNNVTRYSLQACLNSCLGRSQLEMCGCAEASYPSGKQPCDALDNDKRKCLKKIRALFNKDELSCIAGCKRPCREENYEKTISSSKWPSPAYWDYVDSLKDIVAPNESDGLLLNIFYSKLNHQVIEETFSYGTTNLLADIGGQLGLWIGISALTCGEILELIFQLLALAYMKIKNRRRNRVTEIQPPATE